jgi:hypothetical protein
MAQVLFNVWIWPIGASCRRAMLYRFVLTLSGVEPAETWPNDDPDPLAAA